MALPTYKPSEQGRNTMSKTGGSLPMRPSPGTYHAQSEKAGYGAGSSKTRGKGRGGVNDAQNAAIHAKEGSKGGMGKGPNEGHHKGGLIHHTVHDHKSGCGLVH